MLTTLIIWSSAETIVHQFYEVNNDQWILEVVVHKKYWYSRGFGRKVDGLYEIVIFCDQFEEENEAIEFLGCKSIHQENKYKHAM